MSKPGKEIRRCKDFDAVFLWVLGVRGVASNRILGIRTRDHYPAVGKEDGFGVVHAGYGCVGHYGDAGVEGEGRVVEEGVEVGVARFAETGPA